MMMVLTTKNSANARANLMASDAAGMLDSLVIEKATK